MPQPPVPPARVKVWDLPVRLLHWGLAAAVAGAWWASGSNVRWHEPVGYAAAACVALRLAWGLVGSRHARFADFVRGPRATAAYAGLLLRGREPRHLGHNPLGGWMALALWAGVSATAFTGWLYTTDAYWGEPWLDLLHRVLAWAVVVLVALHLAGVAFTGWRHRENLVAAMFSGLKRLRD